jgi:mono/diheme cytochrome c family protein
MKYLLHSVAFLSLIVPWTPATAADAANGRRLAARWCASCHVISSSQTQASADAPPFTEVAKEPGFDAARLALFLLDPHPRMPSMSLTRSEAADLAAYIESLRALR